MDSFLPAALTVPFASDRAGPLPARCRNKNAIIVPPAFPWPRCLAPWPAGEARTLAVSTRPAASPKQAEGRNSVVLLDSSVRASGTDRPVRSLLPVAYLLQQALRLPR